MSKSKSPRPSPLAETLDAFRALVAAEQDLTARAKDLARAVLPPISGEQDIEALLSLRKACGLRPHAADAIAIDRAAWTWAGDAGDRALILGRLSDRSVGHVDELLPQLVIARRLLNHVERELARAARGGASALLISPLDFPALHSGPVHLLLPQGLAWHWCGRPSALPAGHHLRAVPQADLLPDGRLILGPARYLEQSQLTAPLPWYSAESAVEITRDQRRRFEQEQAAARERRRQEQEADRRAREATPEAQIAALKQEVARLKGEPPPAPAVHPDALSRQRYFDHLIREAAEIDRAAADE